MDPSGQVEINIQTPDGDEEETPDGDEEETPDEHEEDTDVNVADTGEEGAYTVEEVSVVSLVPARIASRSP